MEIYYNCTTLYHRNYFRSVTERYEQYSNGYLGGKEKERPPAFCSLHSAIFLSEGSDLL